MAKREETTTRNGCRVTVEEHGDGFGVTIVQKDGRSALYVCGKDEARVVAALILRVTEAP